MIPEKTAWFLLLQCRNQVWLEQRHEVGLWGGLFCFTQFLDWQSMQHWLYEHGLKLHSQYKTMKTLRHTFSHFHLNMIPIWFFNMELLNIDKGIWYNLSDPPNIGLASPILRLLLKLQKSCSTTPYKIILAQNIKKMSRTIYCVYLKRQAEGQEYPYYPGELGKLIYETISQEAWAQWKQKQTMLINELKLSMINPDDRKLLEKEMIAFLFSDQADSSV